MRVYGINDQIHGLVKSFLTDRRQVVMVNGEISTWKDVTSGIPQGSVLGPLLFVLFIMFMNDLPGTANSHTYLFADDKRILIP
jgi:hypothetical protein